MRERGRRRKRRWRSKEEEDDEEKQEVVGREAPHSVLTLLQLSGLGAAGRRRCFSARLHPAPQKNKDLSKLLNTQKVLWNLKANSSVALRVKAVNAAVQSEATPVDILQRIRKHHVG